MRFFQYKLSNYLNTLDSRSLEVATPVDGLRGNDKTNYCSLDSIF